MTTKNDGTNICVNCHTEMVRARFETPGDDWVSAWLCECEGQVAAPRREFFLPDLLAALEDSLGIMLAAQSAILEYGAGPNSDPLLATLQDVINDARFALTTKEQNDERCIQIER